MIRSFLILALVLLTSCERPPAPSRDATEAQQSSAVAQPDNPPSRSDAPDASTENPAQPSAQVAADVVRKYFQLLAAKQLDAAAQLLTPAGRETLQTFSEYLPQQGVDDVRIGEPGRIEGAAGSLYVTIPVHIIGRDAAGAAKHMEGDATLRRSNNVPGATAEQLSWRIERIELLPPSPEGRGPG